MNLTTAAVLFVFQVAIDGVYCFYLRKVHEDKPFAAATSGALIHFLLAYGVISYVKNYWYVVPIALGSWVGTYLTLKFKL